MRRAPPPSLQFLAAAATDSAFTTMSSRPPYRGGRNPRQRGFSNRPYSGGGKGNYVTGDSHFRTVHDANLGSRQGDSGTFPNETAYCRTPPPPFDLNHFRGPPPFDNNQPYRPNQQFRPRPKPLDYRTWELAKTTPSLTFGNQLKLYYHIPHHMMDWQWRKRNLIFELGLWSSDIMCLQEVDKFDDLEEELKLKGYIGFWKMRTGNPVDGCAIFWRTSRFKLVHEESIEFNKLGLRDNVAQICVLEPIRQNSTKNTAALPTSSTGTNKVVICNIHVLYNPRRGEIKLGQVRVLLDRAHTVSKIWNGAPIVLCGDFNCTPKSPLYNFISEQKLDLSGVDRDKVDRLQLKFMHQGHTIIIMGKVCSVRPASHIAQGQPIVDGREAGLKPGNLSLDIQNPNNPESSAESVLLTNLSQPQSTDSPDMFDKSRTNVHFGKDRDSKDVDVTKQNVLDVSEVETGSIFHVTEMGYKEKVDLSNSNHGIPRGHLNSDVCLEKERMNSDIHKHPYSRDNDSIKEGIDPDYVVPIDSEVILSELSNQASITDATEVSSLENLGHVSSGPVSGVEEESPSASYQVDISCTSASVDLELQKNMESVSLNVLDEVIPGGGNTAEDDKTFISALHDTEDAFPSDFTSATPNSAFSASPNAERTYYDPSLWTPMEIETATGNAEHSFRTSSKDGSGARDSSGEPLVTSYNKLFLGTVDYIWRSEGLQTVRVLASIPKQAMQWTSGFPTKKWGSDHIALASELAFINNSDQS
ncbi:unnamed protein product [Malus baccata var. baccata]